MGGRAGRGAQPRRPALKDRGLGRLPQARLLEDAAFATAVAGRGHRQGTRGRTTLASRRRPWRRLPPPPRRASSAAKDAGPSVTCPPSRSTHGPIRIDSGPLSTCPVRTNHNWQRRGNRDWPNERRGGVWPIPGAGRWEPRPPWGWACAGRGGARETPARGGRAACAGQPDAAACSPQPGSGSVFVKDSVAADQGNSRGK